MSSLAARIGATAPVLILLAACVTVPPPAKVEEEDGGAEAVDDQIGGNLVRNDFDSPFLENGSIAVLFDKDSSFDITSLASLRARPDNLLYGRNEPERFIGSQGSGQLYSHEGFNNPQHTELANGPAAYQLLVQWSIGGTAGALGASTVYTVYPDGRIHKSIRFAPELADNPTRVSTYASVHRPFFDRYRTHVDPSSIEFVSPPSPEGSIILMQDESANNRQGFTCFSADSGPLLGVGWHIPADSQDGAALFTELWNSDSDHRGTLDYGWQVDVENPDGAIAGEFLIYAGTTGPEGEECADFVRHTEAFQKPPQLTPPVGQEDILLTTELGDIDDDGYDESAGYYALSAVDTQELRFQLIGERRPPTSAYRIYGLQVSHPPRIFIGTQELVHGTDFLYQSRPLGEGVEGWLYLHRELAAAAEISIEF